MPQSLIHIWWVDPSTVTDAKLLSYLASLLSPDEQARVMRYKMAAARHDAIITRALLRCMLSHYTPSIRPSQWQFKRGEHGKPSLVPIDGIACEFNLSHTKNMIVCALHPSQPLGIDVESVQRRGNQILKIAKNYFAAPEVAQLVHCAKAKQNALFFQIWTLKEAYVKATGNGLTIPLSKFWFHWDESAQIEFSVADEIEEQAGQWQFKQWSHQHYLISLAIKFPPTQPVSCQIQTVRWPRLETT